MMRVLWFEITPPCRFVNKNEVLGGWQDSLERIVRKQKEINLSIAFCVDSPTSNRQIDNVNYIPMCIKYNICESFKKRFSWHVEEQKIIKYAKNIIDSVKPDVIHVFGTEWPYALVAQLTDVPVVVHIQGIIAQYDNANLPPNYSYADLIRYAGLNLRKQASLFVNRILMKDRLRMEMCIWNKVSFYMGRTDWDKCLSNLLHPERAYYHVDEAIRGEFLSPKRLWVPNSKKLKLFSTGCTTFWKGPDMMLKVAVILKNLGVDFEWNVAGRMNDEVKKVTEKKIGHSFKNAGINILGFITPKELTEYLCSCSVYVHTAYVENSPNSICEAQLLGVPVVSTNVGGISSLVKHGVTGLLSPSNDPWMMVSNILEVFNNKSLAEMFSKESRMAANYRHDDDRIGIQLLNSYKDIILKHQL